MTHTRRATNLSLDAALLDEAKELKINLSQAAQLGIQAAVSLEKARRWREENADAIRSMNDWVEKNGLPLEKYRQF